MTLEEIGMEALEGQVILLGLRKDCSHRTGGKRWSRYLPHAPPRPGHWDDVDGEFRESQRRTDGRSISRSQGS
jgi:hypothetical protein